MLYLVTGATSSEDLKKTVPFPALRRIIKRAIAFSPEKRYPSVEALQRTLQRYQKRVYVKSVLLRRLAIWLCIFLAGFGIGVLTGKMLASNQTTVPNNASSLYRYATGSAENRAQDYYFALSDILCDTYSAFDASDGFVPPEEVQE